jgi:hypothetical protein
VTVMPPGDYEVRLFKVKIVCEYLNTAHVLQIVGTKSHHWALPVVTRFNHIDGMFGRRT